MTVPILFHSLAELFPLIEGAELDELVADIKAHGLIAPIIVPAFAEPAEIDRARYRYSLAAAHSPAAA